MDAYIVAGKHLGHLACMISSSKSGYRKAYPTHNVVFNANVCTKEHGKIWYGDLDVTNSEGDLRALASELGVVVYVLYEMDARFGTEKTPNFEYPAWVSTA